MPATAASRCEQTRRVRRRACRPRPRSSGGASGDSTPIRTARSSRPSSTARSQRGERGEVAEVVARERADREAVDQLRRPPCPCRPATGGRSSTALRRVCGASSPNRAARSAATALDLVGPLRRGAPVQRDGSRALALHDRSRAGALRRLRAASAMRSRYGCVRGSTVSTPPSTRLEAVLTRRTRRPGTGSVLERGSRPDGRSRRRRDPSRRRAPRARRRLAAAARRLRDRSTIGESDPSKSTRSAVSAWLLRQRGRPLRRRRAPCDATEIWTPKAAAREDRCRQHEAALVSLSHRVHAHPELKCEEERSSEWTAGRARRRRTRRSNRASANCPTAFSCRFGNGPLHLAICAEYDALPGIGHACGHNIIAAMAVGAGLALAPLVDDLGLTVSVIGTPAEEGGGGKVFLLERGAFDGVHAAMMVHPAPIEDMTPARQRGVALRGPLHRPRVARGRRTRAGHQRGRRVHRRPGRDRPAAPASPGRRPGARRRPPRRRRRQHHPGAHRRAVDGARPRPTSSSRELVPRVHRCFEAGALATGAALEIEPVAPDYTQMEHDPELVEVYRRNAHDARPARLRSTSDDVLHRHGQRLARDAVDPSLHRHRERRRGEPPTRVRGRVHQRVGRPRGARRFARDGVERDRDRDRTAARPRCSAAAQSNRLRRPCRRRRRSRRRRCPGGAGLGNGFTGVPGTDRGRECGRFLVETGLAVHDVAGLACGPTSRSVAAGSCTAAA